MSAIIYDGRGYVLTLACEGSPKTYIFSEHEVGTCVTAHEVRATDYGKTAVLAEAVREGRFYYYIHAEHRSTSSSTWVGLRSEAEFRSLGSALKEIWRLRQPAQAEGVSDATEEAYYKEQREWVAAADRETEAQTLCSGCWKANWQCDGNHTAMEST
jgi:hypothetical protein